MKTIKWIAIFLLGVAVILLLLDRQDYRTSFNEGYQTKVRSLESQIETKEVENRNLLVVADSIATENAKLNGKRAEVKTKWRDKFVEVMIDCDTTKLKELNETHIQSEILCDSVINNMSLQIGKLKWVISNDSTIIAMKDSINGLCADAYLDLEEKTEKDKKKSFWKGLKIGFGTGFVSGLLTGSIFKAK